MVAASDSPEKEGVGPPAGPRYTGKASCGVLRHVVVRLCRDGISIGSPVVLGATLKRQRARRGVRFPPEGAEPALEPGSLDSHSGIRSKASLSAFPCAAYPAGAWGANLSVRSHALPARWAGPAILGNGGPPSPRTPSQVRHIDHRMPLPRRQHPMLGATERRAQRARKGFLP